MSVTRPGAHRFLTAVIVTTLLSATGPARGQDGPAGRPGLPAWHGHLRAVDGALARRDLGAAERAWREAYVAALGSWRWDGMMEVADAQLRIGALSGAREASAARARNLYLGALFRARDQRSVDGVLRAAGAFARLGDRDVVEQCVRLAEGLAAAEGDPDAAERVRAFAGQVRDPLLATRGSAQ